jgi:ferric-chelate reductase [NAD(P)H]
VAKVAFKKGSTGCPLITEHALSVMEAEVMDRIDLGSHTVFVADVISSEVLKTGRPMTYHYYHEHLKGKSPKNAPTFEPPEIKGA